MPETVFKILLGNVVKNALASTEKGSVRILEVIIKCNPPAS